MKFETVKISEFLTERKGRYKPKDEALQGIKRIDKIDFSGNLYLSEKPSNTDMILIKKGDLVISGINVEKGAMCMYEGEEDICATIHYSSYTYDDDKIDLEFLKYFLKSPNFVKALREQVPGGIKTEIKPKHILPLNIQIPKNLDDQKKIVQKLDHLFTQLDSSNSELTHQLSLISQLRQAFLREAMQGTLVSNKTADGKTGADLLAEIKAEKERLIKEKKIKKQKPLPPIADEEIPFEIPENWVWCRLGEIGECHTGTTPPTSQKENFGGKIPFIKPGDISNSHINYFNETLTEVGLKKGTLIPPHTVLMVCIGGSIGKSFYSDRLVSCNQQINAVTPIFYDVKLLLSFMQSQFFQKNVRFLSSGGATPIINRGKWETIQIPIPPLEIQNRIVAKLDELMQYCDALENAVKESQTYNSQLLQQVLREALEGK